MRYVSRKKFSLNGRRIDKYTYLVAIVMPLMTLPQIYSIFTTKNADNVSLISWLAYTLFSFVWIIHGVTHNDKPIIIANILWVIMCGLVTIGVVIYN